MRARQRATSGLRLIPTSNLEALFPPNGHKVPLELVSEYMKCHRILNSHAALPAPLELDVDFLVQGGEADRDYLLLVLQCPNLTLRHNTSISMAETPLS